MSDEALIYTTLTGDGDVSALVGLRVYPHQAQPNETAPWITFQLIGMVPANHLGTNPAVLDERRIQISAFSDNYEELKDLAQKIRTALEPSGHCSFEQDLSFDDGLNTYGISQDWTIFF